MMLALGLRMLLASSRCLGSGFKALRSALVEVSQKAQYPLIQEYSLNHNMNPRMI